MRADVIVTIIVGFFFISVLVVVDFFSFLFVFGSCEMGPFRMRIKRDSSLFVCLRRISSGWLFERRKNSAEMKKKNDKENIVCLSVCCYLLKSPLT